MTFNRTTLELKLEISGNVWNGCHPFNRTTLELKYHYNGGKGEHDDLQSYHTGIEISQSPGDP